MTREEAIKLLTQYIDYDAEMPDYYKMEEVCKVAIKALEQDPCEDAISRQALLEEIKNGIKAGNYEEGYEEYSHINDMDDIIECIKYADSIQPKPKTGHWIDIMVGDMPAQACDQCNTFYPLAYTGGGHKYCPNCGAKMESEVEE